MESPKYAVTRQFYWVDGLPIVEVAVGGLEYANPNALTKKYEGEFEEFSDPREAVEVAIEICKKWRADGVRQAKVAIGATHGMTLYFEPVTFKKARQLARKLYS
jgi:hypothetical protein